MSRTKKEAQYGWNKTEGAVAIAGGALSAEVGVGLLSTSLVPGLALIAMGAALVIGGGRAIAR